MKNVLFLSALLASALAIPGGFYYQESSSRSSSSSYKNNELQHQTEDESQFSKHGDLEGRVDPKVKTYSQHIEYQNPNRQEQGQSANFGVGNQNAFRHLDNSERLTAEQALGSDAIVKTVSGLTGNRNQYAYTATYGVSGGEETPLQGGHYDTQSNLLSLTQRLQNDLSRQLNSVITNQRSYDSQGSSRYVESEFRELERELKANLTRQLQEELQRYYGTQASRGSHSYSVKSGRYAPQANYNTQELDDLTTQVENNLMQQLRNQYQNTQSSSSSSNYYSSQASQQAGQGSRAHTTMYRPYQEPFPLNPEVSPSMPLTEVVSQVQNTVDTTLNDALAQLEEQYLRDVTYTNVPNYDIILQNLKDELKRNLTVNLESTLARYYGTQEEHNNYYYTSNKVASGSRVANYKVDDLNSLRQQVENNLLNKIINSIKQQKENYQTMKRNYSSSQTHSSTYSNNYNSQPDKVYTSYAVFTPVRRPDTTYTQSNTRNTENSYDTYGDQSNIRPAYRPSYTPTPTDNERPIRYDTRQPSTHNTNHGSNSYQTSSQTQETQRLEQLEYDYNPTGSNRPTGTGPTQISQSPYRGTNYPTNTGSYYPSSGNMNYPSSSSTNYPSTSGSKYPPTSGTNYPSGGVPNYPSTSDSNYQTNYKASQANSESSYQYLAGQRQSGIEYTPVSSRPQTEYQAELINIRDQVQDDISRQINTAIQKQRQSGTSYSTSTVSDNQILTDLSEELKRNLTQKIEQTLNEHYGRNGVRGGYSYTVSTGGRINPANYNRDQLTALTNQLQEDLLRQLREGLAHESYQQSTSHTRSSSSYQPVVSHGTYGKGSNSYRSYSSGYSGVYSSGGVGQGECCMQADDSTTSAQDVINQLHVQPSRGDIGSDNNVKKIEDINKDQIKQKKTEDTDSAQEQEDLSADLEVVPPDNIETTTPELARNKPSKRPTRITPIRQNPQHLNIQQETTTPNKPSQITQDLIDCEKHNGDQQQTEDLRIDQQNLEQTHIGNFDQQNMDNFDQQSLDQFDQQTLNNFGQQIWGNTDQQEDAYITQQSLNQHEQLEDETTQTDGIIQQSIQRENVHANRQMHSSNSNIQSGSIYQSHNSDTATHDTGISQQTQDLSQHYRGLNQGSRYQPSSVSQTRYIPQQQTEDLSQQTEDLTQQTEDLTQQTEDFSQHTEDLAQHTEDLSQHTEDLAQHTEDLTQQTQNLHHQFEESMRRNLSRGYNSDVPLGRIHSPQQNQHMSQQTEDVGQHVESLHQNTRGSYGGQNSQSSYHSFSSQASSAYSSSSSAESRHLHSGTISQVPIETTGDLVQQHLEEQHASVVQDVSHQVIPVGSIHTADQKLVDVETLSSTTTAAPGFWKKLGGKITNTYHKAKDSITSIG